jgi:gamma-glutamylcyclotransferase (GGCT)/AIG2-like uncharacterized protein YtfP
MKYFAYGSNMDVKRMTEERKINFSLRKHATLKGFILKFNKVSSANPNEGYANIVIDKNGTVEGVLYEILDSDLSKLDLFEGYPKHYNRIKIKIKLDNGQEVESVVYIAQPDKVKDGLKPTKKYLDHLLSAKDILTESYYKKLVLQEILNK